MRFLLDLIYPLIDEAGYRVWTEYALLKKDIKRSLLGMMILAMGLLMGMVAFGFLVACIFLFLLPLIGPAWATLICGLIFVLLSIAVLLIGHQKTR